MDRPQATWQASKGSLINSEIDLFCLADDADDNADWETDCPDYETDSPDDDNADYETDSPAFWRGSEGVS